MKLLFQYVLPFVLASSTIATPALSQYRTRRAVSPQSPIDCTKPEETPNVACWDQLSLTEYLTDPVHGWIKTTPTCTTVGSDNADCCRPEELWASCFLRLATGSQQSCDIGSMAERSQCFNLPTSLRPEIGPAIVNQVGYVLRTIRDVARFFSNYDSSKCNTHGPTLSLGQ